MIPLRFSAQESQTIILHSPHLSSGAGARAANGLEARPEAPVFSTRARSANSDRKGAPMLTRLRLDLMGVTAIEYGLIVGAIAVAIIAVVFAMGGDLSNLFGTAGSAIAAPMPPSTR
jgi:Flp pilus assembly pilin Flp